MQMCKLSLLQFPRFIRHYRPAVSPAHQEKIMAIRTELAALGVATGRSRAKRNRLTKGVEGSEAGAAIDILREADLKWMSKKNENENETGNDNKNENENKNKNGKGNGIEIEIESGETKKDLNSEKKRIYGHNSLLLNAQVKLLKEQSNGFRGVLNLPNPQLLSCRPSILVFATGEFAREASAAGANIVGGDELISGLIEGTLPAFNRCIATTSMLPTVMKVARILGPKGLMPNVKTGTLVESKEIGQAVKNCLQTVPFKIEKCAGLLNMPIGSLQGANEELTNNLKAVLDHLLTLGGGKKRYIERLYLSTRGHPGIRIKL